MESNSQPVPPSDGATYAEVLARLKDVSARITDILRTIGIGTVVFCWGLFTADKGLASNVASYHRRWIVITAAIAVSGLLCDFLQAIVSYWVANRLRRKMEDLDADRIPYPYESLLYRSQTLFFATKAILMPVAAGSIIILLFIMVWNADQGHVVPPPACACQAGPIFVSSPQNVAFPQPHPQQLLKHPETPCKPTKRSGAYSGPGK
jgi:hypothetical protein